MSWSLIDREESEGGEIVKQHNSSQLELKLSSFLWDSQLRNVSCTAEMNASEHKCICTL